MSELGKSPTPADSASTKKFENNNIISVVLHKASDGTAVDPSSGGGGGGAATVADGADVTQGAKADTAATSDTGTFSIIALFKRLLQYGNTSTTSTTSIDGKFPAAAAPSDAASNAENATSIRSRMAAFNGTSWDRVRSGQTSPTSSTTGVLNDLPLTIYNTSAPAPTNGQAVALQSDASGNLKVAGQATENHLGEIGGRTRRITGSITRPANTTAYTANTIISTATSGGSSTFFLSSIARLNGGSLNIVGATLLDESNPSTKGDFDVYLFLSNPAQQNDNTAFNPSNAEMETCIGVISFYAADAKTGSSNVFYTASLPTPIGFAVNAGGTAIAACIVPRNAYTPASSGKFFLSVQVVQD